MWRWIWIFAAVLCLVGCKTTEYIEVPSVSIDTVYVSKVQRDSVHVHDSVFVNQWMNGDTVYIEKTRWKEVLKEKVRVDTLWEHRIDTVSYPQPLPEGKGVEMTWWQQTRMHVGTVALAVLGVVLVIGILRVKKILWP